MVGGGGRSRVDGAAKTVADQSRQVAGVIHVRMGQDYRIYGVGGEREMAVALEGLLAPSLIESAIEKEVLAAGFQVVHGAGYSPGRAPKCYLHS